MRRLLCWAVIGSACLVVVSPAAPAVAAVPANDAIEGATEIESFPFSSSVDTREATQAPGDPTDCGVPANSIWYTFAPATDTHLLFITSSSTYPVTVAGFTGTPGDLTVAFCVAGDNFGFLTGGLTYWFMAYDASGLGGGDLSLEVHDSTVTEFTEQSRGLISPNGSVTVFGTMACHEDIGWSIWDLSSHQYLKGELVSGSGQTSAACSPTPQAWSYVITPDDRPFTWRVPIYVGSWLVYCLPSGYCDGPSLATTVRLERHGPRGAPAP